MSQPKTLAGHFNKGDETLKYKESISTIKKSSNEQYILSLESYNLSRKFKLTYTEPGLVQKSIKIWVREGVMHIVGLVEKKSESGSLVAKHLSKAFLLPHGIVYEKILSYFNKQGHLVIELPLLETSSTTLRENHKCEEIKPKQEYKYGSEANGEKTWKILENRLNLQKRTNKPTWETKYECTEDKEDISKFKHLHPESEYRRSYFEEDKEENICNYLERVELLERLESQIRKPKLDREYECKWEEKNEKSKYELNEKLEKRNYYSYRKPTLESLYDWEDISEEKEDYLKQKKCEREEKAYKNNEDVSDLIYGLRIKPEKHESKYFFDEKIEKQSARRGSEYVDLLTGFGQELTDKVSIYDLLIRK